MTYSPKAASQHSSVGRKHNILPYSKPSYTEIKNQHSTLASRRRSSIPTESSPNFKIANSGKLSCSRKQPSPQKVTIAQEYEQDPDIANPEGYKDLKLSQIVKEKSDIQIGHVCCHQNRGKCDTCSNQWAHQKNATRSSL